MAGGGPAARFRNVIRERLVPALQREGFEPMPGTLVASAADGVFWMIDLDIAPWSNPKRISFALAWGVYVPGVRSAMGDSDPQAPSIETCAVRGRLGEQGDRLDPAWFELRARPWPLSALSDASLTRTLTRRIAAEVMPHFALLANLAAVQDHLYEHLEPGRGVPDEAELRTLSTIAAISLLRGERDNAARWIEHLTARSEAAMAPDVVAARLAPLRQHLVAS